MCNTLEKKYIKLQSILEEMKSVVVGFSAGVDSTFLLKVAADTLGENAVAVIAVSSTLPDRELNEAIKYSKEIGSRLRIVHTEEEKNPKFSENPINRCYFCKFELYSKLLMVAKEEDIKFIADGTNSDDSSDFRPGLEAQGQFGVRSPLREAGMTKDDIRKLSEKLGLETFDKPAFACLSSRIPYGTAITKENLTMVGRAEEFIRSLGFREVRVRHYDNTARIEVGTNEMELLFADQTKVQIINELKEIGYLYITIDLEGFRSGSMNAVLKNKTDQS